MRVDAAIPVINVSNLDSEAMSDTATDPDLIGEGGDARVDSDAALLVPATAATQWDSRAQFSIPSRGSEFESSVEAGGLHRTDSDI